MKRLKDLTNTETNGKIKKRKCIKLSNFSEIAKFDIDHLSAGDTMALLTELGQLRPNNRPARLAKLIECFDAQGGICLQKKTNV